MYEGWPRITEKIRITDRQRPLSTSGKRTSIPWFISFPTSARQGRSTERWAKYRHVRKTTLETPTESIYAAHIRFKPSFCVKILRIDSCGMCRTSARARMVICQSSSTTAAAVLMLVAVTTVRGTPPCGSNSADSCLSTYIQRLYATTESGNHLTFPSQMPSLITQWFQLAFPLSAYKIWSRSVIPHPH